jgi:hypothetical protein
MLLVTMLLASLKRKPAISTQPRRYYHSWDFYIYSLIEYVDDLCSILPI